MEYLANDGEKTESIYSFWCFGIYKVLKTAYKATKPLVLFPARYPTQASHTVRKKPDIGPGSVDGTIIICLR